MGNGYYPKSADEYYDYGYDPVDSDGYLKEDYKRYLDYMEQLQYGE